MAKKKWYTEKIQKADVKKAVKKWEKDQYQNGFRESTRYDVIINKKRYPPKAIASLAYESATGISTTPKDFRGKVGGAWHKRFTELGYEIVKKVEGGQKLELRKRIRKTELLKPVGNKKPGTTLSQVTSPQRNVAVKAWVLEEANGKCECCSKAAPFKGNDGVPYLEVHHVRSLADQGEDTVENTVAVCPNCHRELHHGEKAKELARQLYHNISRLNCE